MIQPLWKILWLVKFSTYLPHKLAVLLLVVSPREMKSCVHTKVIGKCLAFLSLKTEKKIKQVS